MSGYAGVFDESTEGEELAQVITDHWGCGAGAWITLDEVIYAHETTGVPIATIEALTCAINSYRGHSSDADILSHAFVPADKERAVRALLDVIQSLCVKF